MLQADLVDVLREVLPGAHIMISNNSTAMAYSVFAAHTPKAPLPLLAISIHEGISAGVVGNTGIGKRFSHSGCNVHDGIVGVG